MRWKWFLVVFFLLIVAVVVTIYLILSSYDFNNLKPTIAQQVKIATGRELTLGGNIQLAISLSPSLVLQDVSFQNAPDASRPEMARVGRVEVKVALLPLIRGDLVVKRLLLFEPDILIEIDKAGKPNFEFDTKKKGQPEQPKTEGQSPKGASFPALAFNSVEIEKGRITYIDDRRGKSNVMALSSFKGSTSAPGGAMKFELRGAYNDKSFEAKGSLGPLSALLDPEQIWPINLEAKAYGTKIEVNGTIKDVLSQQGIQIDFQISGNDVSSLEELVDQRLAIKGPFGLSGALSDPAPKTYKVSGFHFSLGDSDLTGTLETNLTGIRPRFNVSLTSQGLDLRPLAGVKEGKGGVAPQTAKTAEHRERVFSSDPLPLKVLKQMDAEVKIRAARVLTPRLALKDLTIDMVLEDGHLTVTPFTSDVGGGKLDASLDLGTVGDDATITTHVKLKEVDVGRMAKELQVKEFVEGKLDGDIDVKGNGRSMAEIMGGLNGKTFLVMNKGRIANKYIDLIGGDLSSSIFRILNPMGDNTDFTEINCLVSAFEISNGLADSKALVIDTTYMSVAGSGQIDLKTEKLDISINPYPKEGLGTSGVGKVNLSLSELAKPFRLGGTLAKPALAIDVTRTAITLGETIGSMALFGPVGIIAALVNAQPGVENPCLAAIEAAKQGGPVKTEGKKGVIEKATEGVAEGAKGAVEGVGSKLKKLFSK
jgi:uncharacterized protein involved in outer membrane biogenesis